MQTLLGNDPAQSARRAVSTRHHLVVDGVRGLLLLVLLALVSIVSLTATSNTVRADTEDAVDAPINFELAGSDDGSFDSVVEILDDAASGTLVPAVEDLTLPLTGILEPPVERLDDDANAVIVPAGNSPLTDGPALRPTSLPNTGSGGLAGGTSDGTSPLAAAALAAGLTLALSAMIRFGARRGRN